MQPATTRLSKRENSESLVMQESRFKQLKLTPKKVCTCGKFTSRLAVISRVNIMYYGMLHGVE